MPAIGLLIVLAGVAGLFLWRGKPSRSEWWKLAAMSFVILGSMWTLIVFGVTFGDYAQAHKIYRNDEFYVVEGVVANFRPMPTQAHQEECFSVEDRIFCYSDSVITSGFNQTSIHGGPIHEGLPVRIEYVGDTILRLEVQNEPTRKGPTPAP